jgi:hypothetical protein
MIAYLIVAGLATIGGIAVFAGTDSDALKGKYSTSFYQNRQAFMPGQGVKLSMESKDGSSMGNAWDTRRS